MDKKQIDIESIDISLGRLIEMCKSEFGEEVNLDNIKLSTSYEQFRCFGYDLYDPVDYHVVTHMEYDEGEINV